MAQEYNAELTENMRTIFPGRDEASYAWGRSMSCILGISPHLRFFVPFSSVDENFDAYDLSGQGRMMTQVSLTAASYAAYGALVPYVGLDGVADYLTRLDEPGLDFTGEMTVFCWFRIARNTNAEGLITKIGNTNATSNFNLVYRGDVGGDPLLGRVYSGANAYDAPLTLSPVLNSWTCAALRFTPSANVAIMMNGIFATNGVGMPAALNNSAFDMQFGAANGASFLQGNLTLCCGWAKALTGTQLVALYQATYPLFYGV